jgi:hypothetical protein
MIRAMSLTASVLAIALVATAGTSAATIQPQRDRCAREGSVTLISTKIVRVYRDRRATFGALAYACHRPTGRATQLGAIPGFYEYGGRRATAVRGSTVAYGLKVDPEGDEGSPAYSIVVVRLPFRGRAWEGAPQFDAVQTEPFDPAADDNLAVERLIIAPNRTIAYTTCTGFSSTEPDRCVRPAQNPRVVAVPYDPATRRYGPAVVLDQSPDLDPRSLRLSPSGSRLAWNDGELRRSVPTP